jgi:hypothetical protein
MNNFAMAFEKQKIQEILVTMLTRSSIASCKKSALMYRRETRRSSRSSIRTMILSAMKKPMQSTSSEVCQFVITTAMARVSLKDIGNVL